MSSDFGCRKLDDERYVVRVFGSEYTFTHNELGEFIDHLHDVRRGLADESFGDNYHSIPPHEPPARRGEGKVSLEGLFGPRPTITRRI